MLNVDLHKVTLVNILKAIYSDSDLRTALGFKGGTAAFLFYNLPRFSVDLDFDLIEQKKKDLVFNKLKEILPLSGKLSEAVEKRNTLFFLLNYEKGLRNIKVEISKRESEVIYEVKNYLGIPILVTKKEDMVACKLSALITRGKFASRDLFDLWFFLENKWQINENVVVEKTNLSLEEALEKAKTRVAKVKKNQLLSGLGELVDQKQKTWIKDHLKDELLFYLNLCQANLKE